MDKDDKDNKLLEEYKIGINEYQYVESNIWNTAGIIGISNVLTLLITVFQSNNSIIINIIGFLLVIFTWIWWKISERWWDIEHTIFLRLRHIEDDLKFYLHKYVSYRDETLTDLAIKNIENEIEPFQLDELKKYDKNFKKRGVKKALKYLPISVTIVWIIYFIINIIKLFGGIKMNFTFDNLWTIILISISLIGSCSIGFAIGLLVGGKRRIDIIKETIKINSEFNKIDNKTTTHNQSNNGK